MRRLADQFTVGLFPTVSINISFNKAAVGDSVELTPEPGESPYVKGLGWVGPSRQSPVDRYLDTLVLSGTTDREDTPVLLPGGEGLHQMHVVRHCLRCMGYVKSGRCSLTLNA